jgi:bifunctional non-homologous end joining protein LigD
MGVEGIICKRANAPYRAGRSRSWLKVKCLGRDEFVIIGWTPPSGSRVGIGGLQLGYYHPTGRLHYAGGVGTGFSDQQLQAWRQTLDGMAAEMPPGLLVAGEPLDPSIRWVQPDLVVEVRFVGWSASGRVRHAVFLGLRADKPPCEVVRDIADPDAPRWTQRGGARRWG